MTQCNQRDNKERGEKSQLFLVCALKKKENLLAFLGFAFSFLAFLLVLGAFFGYFDWIL
jgi:hypothetical protein